jgi:hypothetical protein
MVRAAQGAAVTAQKSIAAAKQRHVAKTSLRIASPPPLTLGSKRLIDALNKKNR